MKNKSRLILPVFLCVLCASAVQSQAQTFKKQWLTAIFYSEGANFADFNNDKQMDVVAGPFIYEGPNFTVKRAFKDVVTYEPLAYSQNFLAFSGDFNRDGWNDVFIIGFPGEDASWYENPKSTEGKWKRHIAFKVVDNESPTLGNLVGDETPELIFNTGGRLGYATPNPKDAGAEWTFHPISPKSDYQRFTHGLGFGDVNGDGRADLLEKNGWWEQPESLSGDPEWKKHPVEFSGGGGAQMYAYDVDGDGDNDVITSIAAHGYGIAWYEQTSDGFTKHSITADKPGEKLNGVQFSQPHAMAMADVDGDGVLDLITGKRFWAHGPEHDPEPNAPAVLYWFRTVRDGNKSGQAKFEPNLIDDNSGVGTQVVAGDISGDGKVDVVVGNKKGAFTFIQQGKK